MLFFVPTRTYHQMPFACLPSSENTTSKPPIAVVTRLRPGSLPATIVMVRGHDLSALPGVGAMALGIQCRDVALIFFDFGELFPSITAV